MNKLTEYQVEKVNDGKQNLKDLIRIKEFHLSLIDDVKEVILSMDNKIVNKKLVDAIDKVFKDKYPVNIGYINLNMEKTYTSENRFTLNINCYRSSILDILNSNEGKVCYYGDFDDLGLYHLNANEILTPTDTGKYRINAEKLNEKFTERQTNIRKDIDQYKESLKHIDDMISEMLDIRDRFKQFDDKYDYTIKKIFGCNYRFQYYGDYSNKIF